MRLPVKILLLLLLSVSSSWATNTYNEAWSGYLSISSTTSFSFRVANSGGAAIYWVSAHEYLGYLYNWRYVSGGITNYYITYNPLRVNDNSTWIEGPFMMSEIAAELPAPKDRLYAAWIFGQGVNVFEADNEMNWTNRILAMLFGLGVFRIITLRLIL